MKNNKYNDDDLPKCPNCGSTGGLASFGKCIWCGAKIGGQ